MNSQQFVTWMQGFTEACNDYTATPKQWDRIKDVLNGVKDYNDNPGLDDNLDDWYNRNTPTEASSSRSILKDQLAAESKLVWNDQTGDYHYVNSPGKYGTTSTNAYGTTSTNASTFTNTQKQQLND